MTTDLLTSLAGATVTQVATGALAVAAGSLAAMAIWDWFRARVIEQWERDYR
jgi:hypothetical protein